MPDQTTLDQTITEEEKKEATKGGIPVLRTLKTDTADYIKEKKVSLIDIAAETAKRGGLKYGEEKNKAIFVKIIAIAAVIVIVAGAGLAGFSLFKKEQKKQQPVSALIKPIIVADDQIEANLDQGQIKAAIQSQIKPNHLLNILIAKKTGEFFSGLGINPPAGFLDSLDDRFMLAKFYLTKDWPILIFKIKSYDSSFAGMIKWEGAISEDLSDLFNLENIDYGKSFEDKEIQNKDTRVLKGKNGNLVLIYSFINQKYLIITTGEEPLIETFRRFSSPQYLNE